MATSSSLLRRLLAAAALLGAAPAGAVAQGLTQDEALRLAFPAPARIERRTAFLTPAQLDSARAIAGPGVEVAQGIVTYYVGLDGTTLLGTAYFDSHRVRTLNEVVMVVVTPEHVVRHVEVLRFGEPPEYKASAAWLDQLEGKPLDERLSLKRGVVNLSGATLTSQALVKSVRRVLALDAYVRPTAAAR